MAQQPYQVGQRRPIATRQRRWARGLAQRLARGGIRANEISLAGMVCALLGGAALAGTALWPDWQRPLWLAAALVIQLRLLANMLDGMVAIAAGHASPVGELYNEVPDRVSDSALLIGAGYALGGHVELGWAAACLALFTAYVRAMGKVAGAQQEFCGPMAKQQRMFVLTLACLYLGLAPADWQLSWGPEGRWGLAAAALAVISAGSLLTALRRLRRAAQMLKKSSTVEANPPPPVQAFRVSGVPAAADELPQRTAEPPATTPSPPRP